MIELLVFIALGSITGILAGMFGIGGGVLLVPVLIFIFYGMGMEESVVVYMAIGTTLSSIIFSGISSAHSHHSKKCVEWKLVFPLSLGMIVGAFIGSRYATSMSSDNLKLIITIFLIAVGGEMLFGYTKLLSSRRRLVSISNILAPIHGGWIGFLSSILGIGGGSFTTPLMTLAGYNIRQGIGTAAACGVPIALAGAMGYLYFGQTHPNLPTGATGFIFWPAVLGIASASIITARIGSNIAHSISEQILKRLFGVLLVIAAIMVTRS